MHGNALVMIASRTSVMSVSPVNRSCSHNNNAARALTMGVAKLDPVYVVIAPPGTAPGIFSPGASTPCEAYEPP